MGTNTVNISFNEDLLREIDRVAGEEARSRSEFIREAARMYLTRKEQWNRIFEYGKQKAKEKNLSEEDITAEINSLRRERKQAVEENCS